MSTEEARLLGMSAERECALRAKVERLERENEKLRTELWSAHYQLDNSSRPSVEELEGAFEWLQRNAPVSIRYMTGNEQWNLPPAYCVLIGDQLFYGTTVFHAVREAMLNDPKAR